MFCYATDVYINYDMYTEYITQKEKFNISITFLQDKQKSIASVHYQSIKCIIQVSPKCIIQVSPKCFIQVSPKFYSKGMYLVFLVNFKFSLSEVTCIRMYISICNKFALKYFVVLLIEFRNFLLQILVF